MAKLEKKIRFSGTLELVSGLHIGDSNESVQIGGVDASVVRRKDNNQPYIPGSSLKGKIRCLLEQTRGATEVGNSKDLGINNLFGYANDGKPSKLIVRDCYLTNDSAVALERSEYLDFPYAEIKTENTIGRITGTAGNPRKIERVPVGAKFGVEFILNIWDNDTEHDLIDLLKEGIDLLESDYLGGNGSRGYGQIVVKIDFGEPDVLFSIS